MPQTITPAPVTGVQALPPGGGFVQVDGVDLYAETLGDPADPAVLLVGRSVLAWEDAFCERLVAGSRYVIRYDLRDMGRSVGYEPGAPQYTLRDLVTDATGLLDALGVARAHVVASSVGGWIGQLMALDHPGRLISLTLISTRPTAPGRCDPDLPDHTDGFGAFIGGVAQPDWSDRDAVIAYLAGFDRMLAGGARPFDFAAACDLAGRVLDRTRDIRSSLSNIAFIDHGDRWRERLPEVSAPPRELGASRDDPSPGAHPIIEYFTIQGCAHAVRDLHRR